MPKAPTYLVPASPTASMAGDRSRSGFLTIKPAADEAERLGGERLGPAPTPERADPGSRGRS